MLDNLSSRFSKILKTMRGQARLTDENTAEMLREVRMAADDFFAKGFFFDFGDEIAHDGQGDVGFEQRHAYFAQHFCGVFFGQARLAAHGFQNFTEA